MREMRLVQMMHGGLGFKRTWTRPEFLALAIATAARRPARREPASWYAGAPADFVTIDLDRLDRDQIMPVDPIDLLFARGNASLLRDVVVDGQTIVRDGRPTGVDLPAIEQELRGLYRDSVRQFGRLERAWSPLSTSLGNWFEDAIDVQLTRRRGSEAARKFHSKAGGYRPLRKNTVGSSS